MCAGGQPALLSVVNRGHVDAPSLSYQIVSTHPLGEYAVLSAVNRMRFFLGLDDDLRFFYQLGREDAHFAPVIAELYGYPPGQAADPVRSRMLDAPPPLRQRGGRRTRRTKGSSRRLGPRLALRGKPWRAFPDAVRIVTATHEELGRAGVTARQIHALRPGRDRVRPSRPALPA